MTLVLLASIRRRRRSFPAVAFLTGLALAGSLGFAPATADTDSLSHLRDGFFLLHHIAHQESQVHLIALFKTTPPDVVAYIKKVSQTGDDTLAVIERLEKGDDSLRLDRDPLPDFEQQVRKSIQAEKQHRLLFGSKGADFARTLLVTQIEATTYLCNIAQVLCKDDKDADRVRTMEKVAARWGALRDEGYRLLNAS